MYVGCKQYLLSLLFLAALASSNAQANSSIPAPPPSPPPVNNPPPLSPVAKSAILYGPTTSSTENYWDYTKLGADWVNQWMTCRGSSQSPVNIPLFTAFDPLTPRTRMHIAMGNLPSSGNNVFLSNDGHGVKMSWLKNSFAPTWTIAVPFDANIIADAMSVESRSNSNNRNITITLDRIEWRVRSEHAIGGRTYPLEMQIYGIVDGTQLRGCGNITCTVALSIMCDVGETQTGEDNQFLAAIIPHIPRDQYQPMSTLPSLLNLNLSSILPKSRSYIQYVGSETKPPCIEGMLWIIMTDSLLISQPQVESFQRAVADLVCNATSGACSKLDTGSTFRQLQPRNIRPMRLFLDTELPIRFQTVYSAQEVAAFQGGRISYTSPLSSKTDPQGKAVGFKLNIAGIAFGILLFFSGLFSSFTIMMFIKKTGLWSKDDHFGKYRERDDEAN